MNLLQQLTKIDEQEYESLRQHSHQDLKKYSQEQNHNVEECMLKTLNDLHNLLIAWRMRQQERTTGSKHPLSLKATCPECGEGTLMLNVVGGTATVSCSQCVDYEVVK